MLTRLSEQREQPTQGGKLFDVADAFEVLYQGISSLNSIAESRNKFEESYNKEEMTLNPFEPKKLKFEVGQWVDVKDKLEQWIEGTVIQTEKNRVLVHFTNWDSKFDEWITIESYRVAPFRCVFKEDIYKTEERLFVQRSSTQLPV